MKHSKISEFHFCAAFEELTSIMFFAVLMPGFLNDEPERRKILYVDNQILGIRWTKFPDSIPSSDEAWMFRILMPILMVNFTLDILDYLVPLHSQDQTTKDNWHWSLLRAHSHFVFASRIGCFC